MNDGGSLFRGNSERDEMSTSFHFDDTFFKRFGRIWRPVYLMKLPRLAKKLGVIVSWILDIFFG
jgi:hypothetical protein